MPHFHHDELEQHPTGTHRDWEHPDEVPLAEAAVKRSSFFTLLLVFSVLFFGAALLFGVYMIYGGGNSVSSENVTISVVGPVAVAAGQPLSLDIVVQNDNNAKLSEADLILEYPEGTKSAGDNPKDLVREREPLGDIATGELVRRKITPVLYGEEGTSKEIKATVEYHVAGSNALFFAEYSYSVTIGSAPVGMKITALKEVTSGQNVDVTVQVTSNSADVIRGVLVKGTYPFGFTPTSVDPQSTYGASGWLLGDLAAGASRTIHIKGRLDGQDGEERVFSFETGVESENEEGKIATSFLTQSASMLVKRPFIGIAVSLDGINAKEYGVPPGKLISARIDWANNTQSVITEPEIVVTFAGDLFDRDSVTPQGGFYKSSNNTIVWNASSDPQFKNLSPGTKGSFGFTFATKHTAGNTGSLIQKPQVSFTVNVSGKRLTDSNINEEVSTVETRTIKLSTEPNLISRIVSSVGPFKNTGPQPPKADQATTYTVIWSLTNTTNAASKGKVTGFLPPYATWLGISAPSEEKVTYNQIDRSVTWDVGTLAPYAGVTADPREAAFQISFTPSIGQVGQSPDLVTRIQFDATDVFTGASLSASRTNLSTRMPTDPNGDPTRETVVR